MICPKCQGSGEVILQDGLLETLAKFGPRSRHTAADLHDPNESTPNAINNRLEKLRKIGLLQRKRKGRRWVYGRVRNPVTRFRKTSGHHNGSNAS